MLAAFGHRDAGGIRLRKLGDTSVRWDETSGVGATLTNLFIHALKATYALAAHASDSQVREGLFILVKGYGGAGSASATEDTRAARIAAVIDMMGDPYGSNRGIVEHLSAMDPRVLEEAHDIWVQPISPFHVCALIEVWSALCRQEQIPPLPRYLSLMLTERQVDEDEVELPEVQIMRRVFRHVRAAPGDVRTGALRRLTATATPSGQ